MSRWIPGNWRGLLAVGMFAVGSAVAYLDSAQPISPVAQPTCAAAVPGIRWLRVSAANERASLDRWCSGVGAPVRIEPTRHEENFSGPLPLVSWNMHVGGGDLDAFVADLRGGKLTGRPEPDFILLLQEAYRAGEVPSEGSASWAAAVQPVLPHRVRSDVTEGARRLGLWAVYIPSMRNGRPGATTEDRGNAILSTRPLADVTAIELPLENQRRIAIAATATIAGRPIRIVDTHFTNMVAHHLTFHTSRLGAMVSECQQAKGVAATIHNFLYFLHFRSLAQLPLESARQPKRLHRG